MISLNFHCDLDGLYSAKSILSVYKCFNFLDLKSIEYGEDLSYLYNKYNKLIILDFGINFGKEKTILWVDHHIRSEVNEYGDISLIMESKSCVSLMKKFGLSKIEDQELDILDIIDSYTFDLEKTNIEDIIFPYDKNDKLFQYLKLNSVLIKNRKTNLAEDLVRQKTYNPEELIAFYEKKYTNCLKIKDLYKYKYLLYNKILKNKKEIINEFENVCVVDTRSFDRIDWFGYEKNLFYYILINYPVLIFTYLMKKYNIQIVANPFHKKFNNINIYKMLKNNFKNLNGHNNIINIYYENNDEFLDNMSKIIDIINLSLQNQS